MQTFDLIVIGGGSAGYAAARTAKETHERVAIVDDSAELGGLCILRGCMPSKTLLYSAEVLHHARMGASFGLDIPSARADMPALHRRKVAMIDDFKGHRQEQLLSDHFTVFREAGQFADASTFLLSSGEALTAGAFVIATGSVVNFPAIPGLEEEGIWTSDDILDLDFLPESVVVLGGGVVACELSQFLARVGSRVTQVQRSPHILKENSERSAEALMKVFQREHIDLFTGTRLHRLERESGGYAVHFADNTGEHEVHAQHVLNALGRAPAVARLNLEAAGVHLNPHGQIHTDDFQQTSNPRIYAAGDVCGPFEIVHIAILQGEVAARHALGRPTEPVDLDTRTAVVFTDPQIATAGLPIEDARVRGFDLVEAHFPFDDHGKSLLMEATDGYVQVWAERTTGRIIGAECVGKDAGELIHSMAVAVTMKATAKDLLKVHWYHPTLSEIWTYPLEDIAEETG
ncbi:MAG: FAD-dependent oxidoreductase [Verrucomicrobia bacterium]|jgi:pyruvate/2-oxoglutarate dehydrogenase complex dihydrolipoamide dehydrogenase (E3) component|nr:FAD-dependent oxidoreductase [Verrucomicrobiota bacterium]